MHSYCAKLFHCKILLCLRKERGHIPTMFVEFLSAPAFLVPAPVPCARIPRVILHSFCINMYKCSRVLEYCLLAHFYLRMWVYQFVHKSSSPGILSSSVSITWGSLSSSISILSPSNMAIASMNLAALSLIFPR